MAAFISYYNFNHSCWFCAGQIMQDSTEYTIIFSKAPYTALNSQRLLQYYEIKKFNNFCTELWSGIIHKPSWSILWWAVVSLSFQQAFDKALHRVIDLKVHHNDPTSMVPMIFAFPQALICMNVGKQQVIRYTAQRETQPGRPEIVSKAFKGYLIYPHMFPTKQK